MTTFGDYVQCALDAADDPVGELRAVRARLMEHVARLPPRGPRHAAARWLAWASAIATAGAVLGAALAMLVT